MKRIVMLGIGLLGFVVNARAQLSEPELSATIQRLDSLLFEVGFNTCDISQFEALIATDFEFYHDQSGLTTSKEEFLRSIREGLCANPYRPKRELVRGSMRVYPLYANGRLYGAIEEGLHRFYERPGTSVQQFRSIARFTHVWILEDGNWRLQRGLSYDHRTREGSKDGRK